MRFKKGSKVEVFNEKELPSGSWRCAEILSGNGHYYTVRYEHTDDAVVGRVSRKLIRPCPTRKPRKNWVPGDVVEVFDVFSWKMATVLRVLDKMSYLVRLVGSTREIRVQKFDVRLRQTWKDDKWFVIGQGSVDCINDKSDEDLILKYDKNSKPQLRNTRIKFRVRNGDLLYINVPKSQDMSSRNRKREAHYGCSLMGAYAGRDQKYRTIEKDDMCSKAAASANQSSIPQHVDFAHPQSVWDERYIRAVNKRKRTTGVGCSNALYIESTDDASVQCSVGSCSIGNNNFYRISSHFAVPVEESNDQFSDAESVYPLDNKEGNHLLSSKEELAAEVHRLELHAYRSTIAALHASGPLTWEQEALMTNLRLLLHISNDEHLVVIRNLISTGSNIPMS